MKSTYVLSIFTVLLVSSFVQISFCHGKYGPGINITGSPPNYQADCPGGHALTYLPIAGLRDGDPSKWANTSHGPFLSVAGAAGLLGIDGVYQYSNVSYQYYTKGSFTLLWEPGPQVVYGLRWVIIGPSSSRAAPLYFKYTEDFLLGWRGTNTSGKWNATAGNGPAPLVSSVLPEDYLDVASAGINATNGRYLRDLSPTHLPEFKMYKKGNYSLVFEYGPQYTTGDRWVLFSNTDAVRGINQNFPYYYRLSSDGNFGYAGIWSISRGPYPPPTVSLAQGVTCTRCPAGSYSQLGAQTCSRCSAGRYSLGAANACTECEPGRFSVGQEAVTRTMRKLPSCDARYLAASQGSCTVENPGAVGCEPCAAGRFASNASWMCEACPPGTRSAPESASCMTCLPGRHSGLGASECQPCPPGTASNTSGLSTSSGCPQCDVGTQSGPVAGATHCQACIAGYHAARKGLSSCNICPSGTASESGASACRLCPNRNGPAGRTMC